MYILFNKYKPIVANEDHKDHPYECAFDFEAKSKKIETKDNEKKLQIVSEHVPVSVSIFSNVPEYDDKPIFLCNSEPRKLIKQFVQTILKISLKARSINEKKYDHIIMKF
jgi:hypothetical protein